MVLAKIVLVLFLDPDLKDTRSEFKNGWRYSDKKNANYLIKENNFLIPTSKTLNLLDFNIPFKFFDCTSYGKA